MLQKIAHLGIAVKSIEQARIFYEQVLGLVCERIEEVASQQVRIAFFRIGEIHLELLEPTSSKSPIAKFLEKRGEGMHHLAFQSDNIETDLARAKTSGCRLIHAEPVDGTGGNQVAFLHPESTFGLLTEFCSQE